MYPETIIFRQENAELNVVPSIHFNHVFAQKVNSICHTAETRPEAIAVELGPRAASEARLWLQELAGRRRMLPVMLGLIKKNRRIRSSLRQKALQLQRDMGKDLSEIPPEVLKRELGYNGYLLLCLSPTDSIIEAIRCSIELDIPVFGIDLDDMADGIYDLPALIQNPDMGDSLTAYIERNAAFADRYRDEEIDIRRETVMAARVKALMRRYRKVIFTCGMAHWLSIGNILNDPSVEPALLTASPERIEGEFRRIVVHPLIAVQCMDSFPSLAMKYEKDRIRRGKEQRINRKRHLLNPSKTFNGELKKSYRRYFHPGSHSRFYDKRIQDIEQIASFEEYLDNLCLLSSRLVPYLSTIANAAKETMSRDFAESITKTFMDFPWASPDEFPDCELLNPSEDEGYTSGCTVLTNKDGRRGKGKFFIRALSPNASHPPARIPFEWNKSRDLMKKMTSSFTSHTWGPWNRLITSLSLRAINDAAKNKTATVSVDYEGSLLNGIDIKKTIRAFSRGDRRYFVRDLAYEGQEHPDFMEGFPVVWLLQPGDIEDAEWNVLHMPRSYMEKHIRDKTAFETIASRKGCNMVAIIAYGKRGSEEEARPKPIGARCDHFAGMIIFQPIAWTNRQFARWAEMTAYRRAPFCNSTFFSSGFHSDLTEQYRRKHKIVIEDYNWATAMILLAIPYAKKNLSVVVPEGYQIEQAVHEQARHYGVRVKPVSHKRFSAAELERLSRCHLVPAITHEPECIYTADIEEYIGEKQIDNLDLVPEAVREFGNLE